MRLEVKARSLLPLPQRGTAYSACHQLSRVRSWRILICRSRTFGLRVQTPLFGVSRRARHGTDEHFTSCRCQPDRPAHGPRLQPGGSCCCDRPYNRGDWRCRGRWSTQRARRTHRARPALVAGRTLSGPRGGQGTRQSGCPREALYAAKAAGRNGVRVFQDNSADRRTA